MKLTYIYKHSTRDADKEMFFRGAMKSMRGGEKHKKNKSENRINTIEGAPTSKHWGALGKKNKITSH